MPSEFRCGKPMSLTTPLPSGKLRPRQQRNQTFRLARGAGSATTTLRRQGSREALPFLTPCQAFTPRPRVTYSKCRSSIASLPQITRRSEAAPANAARRSERVPFGPEVRRKANKPRLAGLQRYAAGGPETLAAARSASLGVPIPHRRCLRIGTSYLAPQRRPQLHVNIATPAYVRHRMRTD